MPSRRDYLAVLGATVPGLAGCLSEAGETEGDGTPPETATDDATRTVTDDATRTVTNDEMATTSEDVAADLTVSDVAVHEAITFYHWPGSTRVFAPPEEQYVIATVSGPGTDDLPDFVFEVGGESWDRTLVGRDLEGPSAVAGRSGGQVGYGDDPDGTLAFRVPSPLSGSDPKIRVAGTDATWPLPDEARARLASPPPSFTLESLAVPDSVARSEDVPVDLTVRNTSDVTGRFLAAVQWPTGVADDDEATVVEERVDAGETRTVSLSFPAGAPATDTPTLSVEGCVTAERTVQVEE